MTEFAWFDLGDGRKVFRKVWEPVGKRSDLPTPYVNSDTMDLTEHVDGKFYDSKSAFRARTKAEGCIEVGNDPARHRRQPTRKKSTREERRAAIAEAKAKVEQGYRPKPVAPSQTG